MLNTKQNTLLKKRETVAGGIQTFYYSTYEEIYLKRVCAFCDRGVCDPTEYRGLCNPREIVARLHLIKGKGKSPYVYHKRNSRL